MRLDCALVVLLKFPRNKCQELIKKGKILLNGQPCNRCSRQVDLLQDQILYGETMDEIKENDPLEDICRQMLKIRHKVEVLHTYDNFFVIYKPPNLSCHYSNSEGNQCLLDFFYWSHDNILFFNHADACHNQLRFNNKDNFIQKLAFYNKDKKLMQYLESGWPLCHRLDKKASGIMIIPRTFSAYDYFLEHWQSRKIHRQYVAIVKGKFLQEKKIINKNILYDKNKKKSVISTNGALAITACKKIKCFTYGTDLYTLLQCETLFGRTHQIRVHLKSIGCPIVYDNKYHHNQQLKDFFCLLSHAIKFSYGEEEFYFSC